MQHIQSYFTSKIPVYESYTNYQSKSEEINGNIKFLKLIKKDLESKLQQNGHLTSSRFIPFKPTELNEMKEKIQGIRNKIGQLKQTLTKEYHEASVSAVGSMIEPVADFIAPGSGLIVALGSNVIKSTVHNSHAEEIGEEREGLAAGVSDTMVSWLKDSAVDMGSEIIQNNCILQ